MVGSCCTRSHEGPQRVLWCQPLRKIQEATPFFDRGNFFEKMKILIIIQIWHVGNLYLCFLTWGIDSAHNLSPQNLFWPIYGHAHLFLGQFQGKFLILETWHVGTLSQCFLVYMHYLSQSDLVLPVCSEEATPFLTVGNF